jgi:integrase
MPRPKRLQARAIRRNGRTRYLVDTRPFGGVRRLFDTASEAQAALLQAQLRQTTPKPGTRGTRADMTVNEVATRFLAAKQRRAPATFLKYRNDLATHILPRFGGWPWQSLDRGSVIAFLEELRTAPIVRRRRGVDGRPVLVTEPGKVRSPVTLRGVLATFSSLASYAVDVLQVADANPLLRVAAALDLKVTTASRRAHVAKKTLTASQVERLLARAVAEASGTWLYPLLVCVLRVGLRIGEALALRPEDLDLAPAGKETLRVVRARTVDRTGAAVLSKPKTEAGIRAVRLSAPTVAVLRRWLDVDRPAWKLKNGWRTLPPWLFFADVDPATYADGAAAAGLLQPGNVRRTIRRLTAALHAGDRAHGLPPEACFPLAWTPHGGRHTVATLLVQAGAPVDAVRQLLGHTSARMTLDVYAHSNDPATTAGLLDRLDALAPMPGAPAEAASRRTRRPPR